MKIEIVRTTHQSSSSIGFNHDLVTDYQGYVRNNEGVVIFSTEVMPEREDVFELCDEFIRCMTDRAFPNI